MSILWNDLVYAQRVLRKSPVFALCAVLTIALGIGGSTAIFSVVETVLLRPLPYRDAERLVLVRQRILKFAPDPLRVAGPDTLLYSASPAFEAAATMTPATYDLSGEGVPEQLKGERVSAGIFPMLGVQPALGRLFSSGEERGENKLALLSYALWQRRFGRDPGVIGRKILLSRQPYEIAGVMPPQFVFPPKGIMVDPPADIFLPLSLTAGERGNYLDNPNFTVIGRLRPGVGIERASAEMAAVARSISENFPPDLKAQLPRDFRIEGLAVPFQDEVVSHSKRLLWVLLAAVGCLLLIACVNVANMLLSRAAGRGQELALRMALGAGRARLMRQLLTESVLLSAVGGVLGLFFAWWGLGALLAFLPADVPMTEQIRIDPFVLAAAAVLSLGTGLLFGLAPAIQASKPDLNETLKESGKGAVGSMSRGWVLQVLVGVQVAVALVLLTSAGLLIRSFVAVRGSDASYAADKILTMAVTLPSSQYQKTEDARTFYERLLPRVAALPGVRAAGAASDLPYLGNWDRVYAVEGRRGARLPLASNSLVLGSFFEAMNVPLKRGRLFHESDVKGTTPVAMINETMARRFWPDTDALGRRLKAGTDQMRTPWFTVVGIIADIKDAGPDRAAAPHIYLPYRQADGYSWTRRMNLAVRTSGDALALTGAIRAEVGRLDPALPVTKVQTVAQIAEDRLSPRRMSMWLVTVFAAAALLLAGTGLYGVMAYLVARRTHEIGVRLAMGATKAAVIRMVLGQGMRVVAIGMVAGIGASVAVTRVIESMLYGVSPADPLTYAAVVLLLGGVSAAAHYIPARRAAQVDPSAALRHV